MARRDTITATLSTLGTVALDAVNRFGRFWTFGAHAAAYAPAELTTPRGWHRLLPQCYAIGTKSVPVVMLTGMFVGMVLIVQGWSQFDAANLLDRLGSIVIISVVSELGPVLAGVMVAGRVGGALTAELGTMNVTEQLLAMRSMGADPIRFLVTPRFLACLLLTPLLTCYADVTGSLGAYFVYLGYGGEPGPFWSYTRETVQLWDIAAGMTKALCFGGAIGLISCYCGFHCKPGAEGVGQACTRAFVISFIVILVLDFFLNLVINSVYERLYGFRPLI